jgi:hypothetical protein
MMNARFIKLARPRHLLLLRHRVPQIFNFKVTSRSEVIFGLAPVTAATQTRTKGNRLMAKILMALSLLWLAGCGVFENDAERSVARGWMVPAAYTSADVRIVTHRVRPGTNTEIVCAEPSADVAKAIATAFQGTGSGGNGSVTVGLGFGGASAEAIAELAGRSTALLGLRDGLYRACEAYANGAIGDDAYALIISRYDQLMTTLFLGQDISGYIGGGGAQAKADAPVVNVNMPGSGGSSTNSNASSNKTDSSTDKTKGTKKSSSMGPSRSKLASGSNAAPQTASAARDESTASQSCAAKKKQKTSVTNQQDDAGTGKQNASSKPAISDAGANALYQMNKDYFDLDDSDFHLLLVACINEFDNTRAARRVGESHNWFLQEICRQATNPSFIGRFMDVQLARMQVKRTQPAAIKKTVSRRTVHKSTRRTEPAPVTPPPSPAPPRQ